MIKTVGMKFFVLLLTIVAAPLSATEIVVAVKQIREYEFSRRLPVQGSVESVYEASVSPRIPGPIEEIFVREGDVVAADVTALFQIDSVKLYKNVEIRRQELSIARFSLKEKQARLKQAQADLEKARIDIERARLLWEDNSTSKDNLEKVQLKFRVSELTVEHTEAIIDLAGEQLKQAELAVRIAEKDYADSRVYSPINGRVVARLQEPGEIAAPGKPIILIKDPEQIEVVAHLPAEYYHLIIPASTSAIVSGRSGVAVETEVYFKSPVINPMLRTFQIKCSLPKTQAQMIPGELADIVVILMRRTGLAVPGEAIVHRGGRQVLFVEDSGVARMIEVECGLENDGLTEVTAQQLSADIRVVVRGQHRLEDGQAISVREER